MLGLDSIQISNNQCPSEKSLGHFYSVIGRI